MRVVAPELRWGERTYLMGIVNVTPDSFSGDGLLHDGAADAADALVGAALALARAQVDAGAHIIDVGGESTRPRHTYGERAAVDATTEIGRTEPVVRALAGELSERAVISIDTSKGAVARAALAAGARMVNDVWGARRDPDTARAAAETDAYLVLMHNQDEPGYPGGVVDTVVRWLRDAVAAAVAAGVPRERLLIDPGIGFGKTPDDSLELLRRLREIKDALDGLPLLVGTSRKRFIGELLDGAPPDQRVEGTAASLALAVAAGADVVRVHDVAHIARTVRVADAIVRQGQGR